MRYSYEFKKECIELYRKGYWPKTPEGTTNKTFRNKIRDWVKAEESCGSDILHHKTKNKKWTADQRYELVAQVLAGDSIREVALSNGINDGQLYQWVRKYKALGYNGLISKKIGRPSKEPKMKKETTPAPLTESEREELIRLRAEIEYIKTENEVIKKEIALREEKEAARLKAKKQRSSKNFATADIN
jgi:transposase-like protein